MPLLIINPLSLADDTRLLLRDLFLSNKLVLLWKKAEYHIQGHRIKLTHDVLLKNIDENRGFYYVFGNELINTGQYGRVYPVERVFCVCNGLLSDAAVYAEPRIVKCQMHYRWNNPEWFVQREFNYSLVATHLHIEKPTIIHGGYDAPAGEEVPVAQSFMIMKRLPGMDLFELFRAQQEGRHVVWTGFQRLALTKCLLQALKTEVYDSLLIHRDIKPENLIINVNPEDFLQSEVHVIDYALAVKSSSTHVVGIAGTPGYVPPEAESGVLGLNYDVYSMGMVLCELWYINPRTLRETGHPQRGLVIDHIYRNYFNNQPESLTLLNFTSVYDTIVKMTALNVETRLSLEMAIAQFDVILINYYNPPLLNQVRFNFGRSSSQESLAYSDSDDDLSVSRLGNTA